MSKFQPGQSGNLAGRPRKPKNDSGTMRNLIAEQLPSIIAVLIQQAQAGDVQAARTLLDKALPNVRPVALPSPIPKLADAESLTDKADVIIQALAQGDIGSDTAMAIMNSLGKAREISSNAGQPFDSDITVTICDAAEYLQQQRDEQLSFSD